MPKGRPRKHAKLHMLDGTYQPSRHDNGADALPSVGLCVPTRPLNEHGQNFFTTVLTSYPPGTLGQPDAESLTCASEWVQRLFALREVERSTGQLMIKEAGEISKHYLQYAVRFGLTPADRGKVKITSTQQDDAAAKFFGITG